MPQILFLLQPNGDRFRFTVDSTSQGKLSPKQREFYEATVNKTIRTLVGGASETPEELQLEKADQFGRGRRAKNAVDYSVFLDQSNAESERAIEKHFQTLEKMQKVKNIHTLSNIEI